MSKKKETVSVTSDSPQFENVIDHAAQLVHERAADEAQRGAAQYTSIWKGYVTAITSETPDATALADIMQRTGVSAEQCRKDRELVAKVRELSQLHADRAKLRQAYFDLLAAYNAVRERLNRELDEAERAKDNARYQSADAEDAEYQLIKLAEQRPQLFDRSVTPPRLLA